MIVIWVPTKIPLLPLHVTTAAAGNLQLWTTLNLRKTPLPRLSINVYARTGSSATSQTRQSAQHALQANSATKVCPIFQITTNPVKTAIQDFIRMMSDRMNARVVLVSQTRSNQTLRSIRCTIATVQTILHFRQM